jgi:hypothetical protein
MTAETGKANEKRVESIEGEAEQLQRDKEALAGEVKVRDKTIAGLEKSLAEKAAELASVKKALDTAGTNLSQLKTELTAALTSYKETVVQAHPGVIAELVTGETVEQVNESVKKAKALVSRVRQEMEAQVLTTRIPAGSPPRAKPDLSGLSAREKIQYAIGGS